MAEITPESIRLTPNNTPYGVGFTHSYHSHVPPQPVVAGYTQLAQWKQYLQGYNEGQRRRSLPFVDSQGLISEWTIALSGLSESPLDTCPNCKHPRQPSGQCEQDECYCDCEGRMLALERVDAAYHHPDHYNTSEIEVWDAIVAWDLDFLEGNVIKYIARSGKKDPGKKLEDLRKAQAYINKAIEVEEAKQS